MQPPAVADYPAGARLATRVIDDYELVWMLRGRARLVTDDGELPLDPGLLLLVPPGVRHGYVHFSRADAGLPLPDTVRTRRMTAHDPLAGLCAYLLWLGPDRPTLRFLLDRVVSGPLPDESGSAFAGPLSAIVTYLRSEWADVSLRRIGTSELAAAAGVSRGHLSRVFQAELGIGVAGCLERLRCYRAEILLARTDFPVGTVASQCGFADLYHFRTDSPACTEFRRACTGPPAAHPRSTIPACAGLPASCGSRDLIRGCSREFAGAGSWVVSTLTAQRGAWSPRADATRPKSAGHPHSQEALCASP